MRDHVHGHFLERQYRAWAPCYSVDLVAVLRHAARAQRLTAVRDWILAVLLLSSLVLVSVLLFGWRLLDLLVIPGAVALSVVGGSLVPRRVTWRIFREGIARYPVVGIAALLGIASVAHQAGGRGLATMAAGFLVVWLLVVGFSATAFIRASRLLTSEDKPRDRAKPVSATLERRAELVSGSNLLVYAHSRAKSPLGPFLGAGHRLFRWTTPLVDVNKGRIDDQGSPMKPQEVDVVRLHQQLRQAAKEGESAQLRCQHRLYVDGRSLSRARELLAKSPVGPPKAAIPEQIVLRRVEEPLNYHRGYLCLQVTDRKWDGDVVVTMFVRAVLEDDLLHLEISVHALPPDTSERVPRRAISAAWLGVKDGSAAFWWTLAGAIGRCSRQIVDPVAHVIATGRHHHHINRKVGFDFGAKTSLREHLALGQAMHHNVFVDTMAAVERLQHRLVRALADYLESRGIDLAELVKTSNTFIYNNQQNVFKDLVAGAITFGDNSPATGMAASGPSPPPPAPPPPAGATPT